MIYEQVFVILILNLFFPPLRKPSYLSSDYLHEKLITATRFQFHIINSLKYTPVVDKMD